jgi:hypothetical protein
LKIVGTIADVHTFRFIFYTKNAWTSLNINSEGCVFQGLVELVNSFHLLEHALFYGSFLLFLIKNHFRNLQNN